ncbi:NusB/RsmB/TIM44 [Sesbania bispinosa]|nr:NusB/RsmB/TIM44 [Sesbania bispinosa]
MEGTLLPLPSPSSCAAPTKPNQHFSLPFSALNHHCHLNFPKFLSKPKNETLSVFSPRCSLRGSTFAIDRDEASVLGKTDNSSAALPKIDKTGRFCSPRAARELALSMIYAACLEGVDPVRLFEKRLNARREAGYEFDKGKLLEYNHMSFGGPPVSVESDEEANELLRNIEKESDIEAEVLAAPPKLVYNKLILRFTRKLLVAVRDKWDSHVPVINKVVPPNWKDEPAGKILELSILHLAMSEMAALETRHQIVINEAVDLAKRFCDGAAPRIINGCLRTFVRDLELEA